MFRVTRSFNGLAIVQRMLNSKNLPKILNKFIALSNNSLFTAFTVQYTKWMWMDVIVIGKWLSRRCVSINFILSSWMLEYSKIHSENRLYEIEMQNIYIIEYLFRVELGTFSFQIKSKQLNRLKILIRIQCAKIVFDLIQKLTYNQI